MKTSVHHILDKQQAKFLKKLDVWLADNIYSDGSGGEEVVLKLREMITKIEENGYYDTLQKELLNELRHQYMKDSNEESK